MTLPIAMTLMCGAMQSTAPYRAHRFTTRD